MLNFYRLSNQIQQRSQSLCPVSFAEPFRFRKGGLFNALNLSIFSLCLDSSIFYNMLFICYIHKNRKINKGYSSFATFAKKQKTKSEVRIFHSKATNAI